jgi:hypothetical protein
MFKLPSIGNLLSESLNTFKRFPLALLSAITATGIAIYLVHCDYQKLQNITNLWKVVMCCALGLNLFLSTELFSESKNQTSIKRWLLQLFALILIVCYYFIFPDIKDFGIEDTARFALFVIGLHLLVSFSPFINAGHINGFWQFNKSLFIRFLTASLYTSVLYMGLALALLAIEKLFKVEIKWTYYSDLWWFLAGVFNTWFFLAGVPKQTQTLDTISDYPKGLKIFTQFVLLPLITVYLFILYAYGAKIAIAMELPRGWVSYLVIGFSIVGILSLLLIWPIREHEGNSWIKIVDRWFYRALYPLIILLGLAIFKRVSQYGITENRYFILILALWLGIIATYFLVSKTKNIKVIPISLCLIAFLSSFGPWGAFSISESSQINRLEKLLTQEKLLINGKIKKASPELKGANAQKITALINYLGSVHGFKNIQPWFTQNLDSLFKEGDPVNRNYINKKEIVLNLIGVENYEGYSRNGEKNFYIQPKESRTEAIQIKGFDYYSDFNSWYYDNSNDNKNDNSNRIFFDNDTLCVKLNGERMIILQNSKIIRDINFMEYVKKIMNNNTLSYDNYSVPNVQLVLPIETDSLSIQFRFTSISGIEEEGNKTKINGINAHVLIKRK